MLQLFHRAAEADKFTLPQSPKFQAVRDIIEGNTDIINVLSVAIATALITMFLTAALYQPFQIFVFHVREPYFKYPIRMGDGSITIRNDALGSGEYGSKRSAGRVHDGIDILASIGTPVRAAKSGVAFRLNVPSGHGKYVMIYHPDGDQTIYSHLSGYNIVSTQKVMQGEVIGYVGKTGNAGALLMHPHLHFEIRKHAMCVDPKPLMRK
jgi:murein DD-endopeptidase MepM/ murein hydrolase activator NlpD